MPRVVLLRRWFDMFSGGMRAVVCWFLKFLRHIVAMERLRHAVVSSFVCDTGDVL